jgi:hypothetical protein
VWLKKTAATSMKKVKFCFFSIAPLIDSGSEEEKTVLMFV